MYTLFLFNAEGAVDISHHANKCSIRDEIRRWDAKTLKAEVIDRTSGLTIYNGKALSFR